MVAWGSTALSDMLLTSTLGATLLSFFWGYAGHKCCPPKHRWGYQLSGIFMGLACLAKGPIGIVFPVSGNHLMSITCLHDVVNGLKWWTRSRIGCECHKMIFHLFIWEPELLHSCLFPMLLLQVLHGIGCCGHIRGSWLEIEDHSWELVSGNRGSKVLLFVVLFKLRLEIKYRIRY